MFFQYGCPEETELDEFISYIDNPPVLDEEIKAVIENDKKELAGNFAGDVDIVCQRVQHI